MAMTHRIFAIGVVVVFFGVACRAQDPEPYAAPDDISLTLQTEGQREQFHLGEAIGFQYAYTAPPGKYLYVNTPGKLMGGQPLRVGCIPAPQSVLAESAAAGAEAERFRHMLIDPTCHGGVGGGIGGGCSGCDQEIPLGTMPLRFGVDQLNRYLRFREPGTYSCRVTSAQVTTSARDEKIRPALLVKSNWLKILITDDPTWSRSAAASYSAFYEKNCRGEDVAKTSFTQCSDISRRLTYLDIAESLAAEIRFFDGRSHGWENGFWQAIQTTSHRDAALRQMTRRIQDPDFAVSDFVLQWLAMSAMRAANPDAFEASAAASDYHSEAIEQLRKYVRLLGASLASKNSDVLQVSAKTYETFAEQPSCNGDPLIPEAERDAVINALGSRTALGLHGGTPTPNR